METVRIAHCSCGALEVETRGTPEIAALCSCTECQRRTGAPFGTSYYWPEAAVAIRGEATGWTRMSERGRSFEQFFCPVCGSTVYWRGAFLPGRVGVAGGAFADPDVPAPTVAVWHKHRQLWIDGLGTLRTLDEQRY